MGKTNIYNGPESCYAKREGIYVTTPGVTPRNFKRYVSFLLRDLKRGYTYDHNCRKIPMTKNLFKKRLLYLLALAKKHGVSDRSIAKMKQYLRRVLRASVRKGKTKERRKERVLARVR